MAQTLELKILINADTGGAQRAVDAIKASISSISAGSNIADAGLSKPFESAAKAAKETATATNSIGDAAQQATKSATVLSDAFKFNNIRDNILNATQGLSDIVSVGNSYESTLAAVGAITGSSGDQLNVLGDSARDLAKQFGGSASDQLKSFQGILSKFGPAIGDNPAALGLMAKNVNILSSASGDDAAKSMEAITGSMLQFGLVSGDAAKDAATSTRIIDGLAASAKVGAAEIPEVADAIKVAGSAARGAGLSFESANAAIQVLALGNIKGSEAGTGLRNVLGLLQKASGPAEDALKKMGISSKDLGETLTKEGLPKALEKIKTGMGTLGSAAEKNAALITIFGSENSAVVGTMLNNLDKFGEYETGIKKAVQEGAAGVDGAVAQANVRLATADAISSRIKAQVQDLFISVTKTLGSGFSASITALNQIAPSITGIAAAKPLVASTFAALKSGATQVLTDFGGTVSTVKNGFAGLATSVGQTILPAIARIAPTLVTTNAAGALSFAGLGTAASTAWAAVTGPVGLIVLGLTSVGVAAYALYKNFEPFKNFVDNTWKGIVKAFNDAKPVLSELGKVFTDIGKFVADTFVGGLRVAYDFIKGLGTAITGLLVSAFEKLTNTFKPVGEFFTKISGSFTSTESTAQKLSELLKGGMNVQQASSYLANFTGVLGGLRAALVNVRAFIAGLAGGFEVLGTTLSDFASKVFNPSEWGNINVSGFFDNFQKSFTNRWNQTWEDAKKTAEEGVKLPKIDTGATNQAVEATKTFVDQYKKISDEVTAFSTNFGQLIDSEKAATKKKILAEITAAKGAKEAKARLSEDEAENTKRALELQNAVKKLFEKSGSKGAKDAAKEKEEIEKAFTEFVAKENKLRGEIEASTAKSIAEGRIKSLEETKAALEKNDLLSNTERLNQTIAIEKQLLEERKKTATAAVEEESKKRQATIGTDLAALLDKATKLGAASIAEFTTKTANLTPEKIGDFLTKNAQLTKAQIEEITTKVKETSAAIEAQNAEVTKKTTSEFDSAAKAIETRLKQGSIAAALQDQLRAITQTVGNETQRRIQTEQAQLTDKYRSDLLQLEIAEVRKAAIVADFAQKRLAIEANATLAPDAREKQLADIQAAEQASLQEFEGLEQTKLAIAQQYTAKQKALQIEQFQATGTTAREQVTALGSTLGTLTKGFAGLSGTFAKRSDDYDSQAAALKKRLDEELASVGRNYKKRREIEKKYAEDKKKLDEELGASGAFKALGESAGDTFAAIAEQQRVAFAQSTAGVTDFSKIGQDAFISLGITAAATIGSVAAKGGDVGKAVLKAAFDTLQALVPVIVGQISILAFGQPDSVATFGATAAARIALLTALVQGVVSVTRGIAGFREGGLVLGGKHDGRTGQIIRINEEGEEFVVKHSATMKNLSALTEINRRNITVEQYVRERHAIHTPIETHYFVDEEGALQQGLRRVERAVYDQTDRLESRLVSLENEMHEAANIYKYERKRTDVVISTKDPNISVTTKERKALH